ncbi:MAG: APC family permease [Acidobacteria bacterium]|nr:MAG: APC family permease [Acidobacteriota bacterium]
MSSQKAGSESGQLKRVLSRSDLILYGLVILTPTAAYPVYGIIENASHGHAALSYLVAMVAMLFTAASYARMSAAFPRAGSTYTYAQQSLSERIGFLAGWAMILDYFLIPLLSVVYPALTAARLIPQVPYLFWIVVFSLLITAINVRGIKMTAHMSRFMLAVMSVSTVLFVGLSVRFVLLRQGARGLIEPGALVNPGSLEFSPLLLGAGIATLSYIGFDAVSTLAEDTRRPEKDIGFAIIVVCLLQTVFCLATVYLARLVWPDYRSLPQSETAILDISSAIGGSWMFGWITFVLLVAGLASALTGQVGASRLLYGMGRDGVLPRRFFGYINPKYSTPTRAIYLMGGLCLLGGFIADFTLLVQMLNFGAYVGFILVNLSVIRHYGFRSGGRGVSHWLTSWIFPALGAIVCFYIWLSLTNAAKIAGFGWMALGVLYLAITTRGFRTSPRRLQSLADEGQQP